MGGDYEDVAAFRHPPTSQIWCGSCERRRPRRDVPDEEATATTACLAHAPRDDDGGRSSNILFAPDFEAAFSAGAAGDTKRTLEAFVGTRESGKCVCVRLLAYV
ncbi:hypothetical protein MRX96_011322 [Rhipicephalus microplus]